MSRPKKTFFTNSFYSVIIYRYYKINIYTFLFSYEKTLSYTDLKCYKFELNNNDTKFSMGVLKGVIWLIFFYNRHYNLVYNFATY